MSFFLSEEFCIVGNASVGKSSILVQLTDKRFLGAASEPTVHNFSSETLLLALRDKMCTDRC
jgi:GTPase SAR1 family protein